MKKSKSIRWQITGAFLGFLVLALGLIIFLNMTFMEQYYLENKKEILKTSYETIAKEYDAVDKTDTLKFASTNNLSFVIIDWNGSEPEGYSNPRDSESKKLAAKLFGYIYNFEPKGDKIIEKTNNYTIQFNKDTSLNMEFLEIWGTLDDGVNFIVRSPIESIQKSIALSNRFYLMVALGVCVIGAAFIAFLAKRLTKPLTELTEISRRMANLDFDVKYTSGGEDEIGVLGHNFNQMSETLEQTISELKTANNELQKDIEKKEEIDEVISQLPEKIDSLFLCHGIAQFPGRELLVQKVNFYSQKYMTEKLLDRINEHGSVTYISSVGGFGWQQVYNKAVELINLPTWEDAMEWYDKNPELIKSAYVFAKQCLESYVTYKCMSPEFINKRIRINAINPGDTTTGLTEDFNKSSSPTGNAKEGEEIISNIFLKSWNGYPAEPKDMGYPMVVVGSDICSYMSGQLIYIDFGLTSTWTSGALLQANEKSIEEISRESNE